MPFLTGVFFKGNAMREVILESAEVGTYIADQHIEEIEVPSIVIREGREYTKHSGLLPIGLLTRIIKIIQAMAVTLFTGLLMLINEDFRRFWGELISGKENLIFFAPYEKKTSSIETTEALSLSDESSSSISFSGTDFDFDNSISFLQGFDAPTREFSLKDQFRDTHKLIQSKSDEELIKEEITVFLNGCLEAFSGVEWQEVREEVNEIEKLDNALLIDLFYKAVRIYKDHKKSDPKKVEDKLTACIDLSPAKIKPTNMSNTSDDVKRIGNYYVAVQRAQGIRDEMEDEDDSKLMRIDSKNLDIPYFAVFDGHGGKECSTFLKNNLMQFIQKELEDADLTIYASITDAFKSAFVKANDFFLKNCTDQSGSTATVACIIDPFIWVASTGDTRAVANLEGEAHQLSLDHELTDERVLKGIESRGGAVIWTRLGGKLAVGRAFGNKGLPGVTAKPFIKRFFIGTISKSKPNQLIIACDGLWNVVDSKEAVEIASGKTTFKAARDLQREAFNRRTDDNVTIQVIDLNGATP